MKTQQSYRPGDRVILLAGTLGGRPDGDLRATVLVGGQDSVVLRVEGIGGLTVDLPARADRIRPDESVGR